MGDVTTASAVRLNLGDVLIDHERSRSASNKMLVSAPDSIQFSRRYIRGYDRDH
jgi:hypothetical protein